MSESDRRDLDLASARTLGLLRKLARMKGYPDPKPGILEHEARTAIACLTRLKAGEDGTAQRLAPSPDEYYTPNTTLRGWFTRRP